MSVGRSLVVLALLALACATPDPASDAGASVDAPVDARPMRPVDASPLAYGDCTGAVDCPDDDGCDLTFPRGMCRSYCTTDADCRGGGVCDADGLCIRSCMPGANDCDEDEFCLRELDGTGVCYPVCTSRSDMPRLRCQRGMACTAFCTEERFSGLPIGEPCSDMTGCVTLTCITAEDGMPGGMCTRSARTPPDSAYLASGPIPGGTCEDGLAVFTFDDALEGDQGFCVPRCVRDDDCRDGYRCDRRGHLEAPIHTDGICRPWLCGSVTPCDASDRTCAPIPGSTRSACYHTPP